MSKLRCFRWLKIYSLDFLFFLLTTIIIIQSAPVDAHEAWIQPTEFRVTPGDFVNAHIRVGKLFRGNSQVYNKDKTKLLEISTGDDRESIKGRLGDLPAIHYKTRQSGLHTLTYQSTGSRIIYETWEKFEKFAKKEGVDWILQEHRNRNYPESGFQENFYRYAKSLFIVGTLDGVDTAIGLPLELVALNNPYTNPSAGVEVQLLLAGSPYPGQQVSVFHREKGKATQRQNFRTDAQGKAVIPIEPGHQYLLNAVHMEPQRKKRMPRFGKATGLP